jgi:putative ABC transport system permease protein
MSFVVSTFRSLARELARRPGFLLVAVITLGVGIGANAAIFSVVDAVLIRPLPYPESDRLVGVWNDAPGLKLRHFEQSYGTYVLYRRENHVLEDLGLYDDGSATLSGTQGPERLSSARLTGSLFTVLRTPAALGRTIQEADERPGAEKVMLLSDSLWRRRFGGDPKVLGSTLRVDGVARRIVGVLPATFRFPADDTQIWLPMTIDPAKLEPGSFDYRAIGRLRPGITPRRAAREMSALVWRIPEVYPDSKIGRGMIQSAGLTVLAIPMLQDVVGDVERVLWVILGSVACILLIACANVANLFLVRAEGRQREVAVRVALGASRGDVARLFLGESVALSLLGGLLGLGLAWAGVRLLVRLRPEGIPRLQEIGVDGRVLLFTLALSIVSGLLCGVFAALRYGSPALAAALKEGGRGGTSGRERHLARNLLVVFQVSLALVLLVFSGLMVKSFWGLRSVDPGFDPRGVLTLRLDLPTSDYPDTPATLRFLQQLLDRVRALPQVAAAATIHPLPLSGNNSNSGYSFEDFPLTPDQVPPILGNRFVSPGYFQALGIPVIQGRTFDHLDTLGQKPREVVVSRGLAEHFWPGKSPLGKRLVNGFPNADNPWYTIIGVVGDVHDIGLEQKPVEDVYLPMVRYGEKNESWAPQGFHLLVKGKLDPAALVAPVRGVIHELDPNLPLSEVRPLSEVVKRSMTQTSFTMLLLVIAASVALLLGGVGIYGVVSYVVSQRTREIGVRMALGAGRDDISRMVLKQGLGVTLLGIAIGLAFALLVTRLILALLYGVSPTDPATLGAVPVMLAAVSLLASWVPARRAASVEPLEAIRAE